MTFYELQVRRARKFIEGASLNDWESIVCKTDPGHQRAGRRLTDLFLDVLSWNVVDFSRTMLSDIVFTDRALKVLREAGLTGFEIRNTNIEGLPAGVKSSALPTLWEFVVTGYAGPAHSASGIVKLRKCDACGLVTNSAFERGLLVNESTYDGSDFFTVAEYPKYVLASHRAKVAIESAGLTNIEFVDSSKLEWPKGVAKPRSVVA